MASHITVGFSHLVAIMCKRWHYKGQRSFSNIDPNKNLPRASAYRLLMNRQTTTTKC